MKILSEIPPLVNDKFLIEKYESTLYPLSNKVVDYVSELIIESNTVVLFSGGNRLNFDATYIEPKMFLKADIQWKPKTLFVDPSRTQHVNYVIKKLNPTHLLILNTNMFIRYRLWKDILGDIQHYKKLADKVVVSLPINRFDFNRLKYTDNMITNMMGGTLIDNTIIICQ
jgi:hypothetical protein